MFKKMLLLLMGLVLLSGVSYAQVAVVPYDLNEQYVSCQVPQISGISDGNVQNQINAFLLGQVRPDIAEFHKNVAEMELSPLVPDDVKHYKFESKYTIKKQSKSFLSLTQQEYWFSGGAHGSAVLRAANINLETGQIYKLNQIFKENSDWSTKLNSFIEKEIAGSQHNEGYHFKAIENLAQFYVIEEGLVIYFQPYEIGPWVLGTPKFVIPWTEIGDILNDNIPLFY